MAINGGKKIFFFNASRYLDKNGTGETVAVFQNLLSKLPYFKHRYPKLNVSVLHQGQEIKSELQYHRSLHQAGGLTLKKNKKLNEQPGWRDCLVFNRYCS